MKAVIRTRFGSPDVLSFGDIDKPAIGADDVLVAVHAVGVNRGDVLELRGWPYIARLMGYGLRRPKHPVLGTDVAGRIVDLGSSVQHLAIGDEVVGFGIGGFAEFATLPASTTIKRAATVTPPAAAATPTTGVAALQAVRDAGRVRAGQHFAVIGASGGVGTFAVQIAKAHGAEVTAVASAAKFDLVRSLGADRAIDYTVEDVTTHHGTYDVIIDLVGNQPIGKLRQALTAIGTCVVVGGQKPQSLTGMRRFAGAAARSPFTRQRLVPLFAKPNREDLSTVMTLVESGTVRPVVDRTFDLSETAAAFRNIETGHGTGRTVVTV